MKSFILTLSIGLAGCVFAAKAANYENYSGFGVDDTPVLPASETHPSLWFGPDEVNEVREKKDRDEHAADMWRRILASPYLAEPFPEEPKVDSEKKPIHKYYGTMSQIAKYCAFMVHMTDDSPERDAYLKRAVDALLRAFDGPIYELDPKIKGSPVDEIYIGVWLQNYAAAYDWVQPFLDESQDRAIRKQLARQAIWVADNLNLWVKRPHNHLSKPAWGLGSIALALSSHRDAARWLEVALVAANRNTRYFFSGDGIYREGSHYLIFSWINFVPFLYHYRNVSGVDHFPAYQPAMEWGVAVRNGKGWLPNLEDSFIRPFPSHMVAGAYLEAATWLHSSAKLGNVLQWNFETTDFAPFNDSLKVTGFNYTGASWDYTLPLDEYLSYTPGIEPAAPDVSPTVFLDGGQSMFRNTWKPSDPDLKFLLFHGVAEADNHHHEDHLSFILFAKNQMMASDGGYTRKSYGESMRKTWYRLAPAHNVVTLEGRPPQDVSENVTPVSRFRIDTEFFDFGEKQAPFPNGGTLRRAIAFPGESYFVVADLVHSPEPAEAVLHFHGGRGRMEGEGSHRVWTYDDDRYGPAARLDSWVLGEGVALADKAGELTYIKGDYAEFPYITATATGEKLSFLQILIPSDGSDPVPDVEDLSDESRSAAVVTLQDRRETLLLQIDSNAASAGDLETDGTFCWVQDAGGTIRVALREGTFIRYRGKTLVESAAPVTGAFDLGGKELPYRPVATSAAKM